VSTTIRFDFEKGDSITARLLPAGAPKTVEYVLGLLPVASTAYHTRWCGREVYVPLDGRGGTRPENETATVSFGDVVYWREWGREGGPETISVFYGAESVRDHRGILTVNVIGRVPGDQLANLEQIGLRVWQQGIEKVRVEPVED
jgi:hypothetical protein